MKSILDEAMRHLAKAIYYHNLAVEARDCEEIHVAYSLLDQHDCHIDAANALIEEIQCRLK